MIEYIREQLPVEELLAMLAEEAAELAHAALKLRRVYDGTNPTPVRASDAFAALREELADVRLCARVLGLNQSQVEQDKIIDRKLTRWCERLQEAGGAACGKGRL